MDDRPRILVYVAGASGSGKTRRLLEDARRLAAGGKRVAIGWIETRGRPDLERLTAGLHRISPRRVTVGDQTFEDFDYEAALREKPDVLLLDELAHDNLGKAPHPKRWQDALALKEHGIGVITAFDIAHVETVAPAAEALFGHPIAGIVPLAFLQAADEVVAIDVSSRVLQSRVQPGTIKENALEVLRESLLRTIDSLTLPGEKGKRTSMAAAFVYPGVDALPYLTRTAAIAQALDLRLEVIPTRGVDRTSLERLSREVGAAMLSGDADPAELSQGKIRAALLALPQGGVAAKLANTALSYDLFVVGAGQTYLGRNPARSPYSQTAGDRLRVGYGKLTVYLGAAAGAGKTYAMLDRAHQLKAGGVDVVAGFVETHGHEETAALLDGLEVVGTKVIAADSRTYREFDRDALIARKPKVALIDELAHTNAPGSLAPKRFYDVLAVLRAGIDVITTLNIQNLEGLADTVLRLTGKVVRETLPDGVLSLADEVLLVDVTPETLRRRVPESNVENLFALRELALREAVRARQRERIVSPFERILLAVGSRTIDLPMILRAGRIAARLAIEFAVAHVVRPNSRVDAAIVERMKAESRKTNVEWIEDVADDVPRRLIEMARTRPETTIAVAASRRSPRWFERPSFARRLLDAGARELIVLTAPAASDSPEVLD